MATFRNQNQTSDQFDESDLLKFVQNQILEIRTK